MVHGLMQLEMEEKFRILSASANLAKIHHCRLNLFHGNDGTVGIFILATVGQPEILLLDEGIVAAMHVLPSADRNGYSRSRRQSAILVLASHTDDLIRTICNNKRLL